MKRNMLQKKFLQNLALAIPLGALFLTACGRSYIPVNNDTPRIVIADAITTHHLNLYVAYELGLFDAHGVNVEIITLDTNAAALESVVAGQSDIFFSCPTIAIAGIANGAPFRTVAQVKDPCTSVLMLPDGTNVTSLRDLQGMQIAGISPACEAVLALYFATNADGVDFNLLTMSGGSAIAALEAGQIDGALLEEPHASIAELSGFVRAFEYLSANVTCRTINASNRLLNTNPEAINSFLAAIDEANEIINNNPTADNIIQIAENRTGAPRDAIYHGNSRLVFETTLETDGLILLANALLDMGNISENPQESMFAEQFKGITW
ncbi:MAG: ABC transporter substrate-binding protein [Defluviitaleaceae bacterium]|nr:ABC transporter substrate-binding protein [Defluviitaleaceae bacterium]